MLSQKMNRKLAAIQNVTPEQLYRDIARKNNIPLATVERLAADKAINRAASGEYVQDLAGKWTRKP